MELRIERIRCNGNDTVSAFYIDGKFQCFGIEDEKRTKKVWGETRVPEGRYKVDLRCEGGHFERYLNKYPHLHKNRKYGMLCVYNSHDWKIVTPSMSFQYILIHVGNTDDHTAGCYLPNLEIQNVSTKHANGTQSTAAYSKIYPIIADALLKGESVTIEYKDLEK